MSIRAALAAASCLAALLAFASASAGGALRLGPASTVYIRAGKGGLRFEGPATIVAGEELEVLDQANARRVGPDTFSLVTRGSLPRTPGARRRCAFPSHICAAIAAWQGSEGEGPPTVNPVEAGEEGWDTMGDLEGEGDSWFTGTRPHAAIVQRVSAPPGTTLFYMSAIHPWMHGSIKVLPPPEA